jgi:hypothetical protein
MQYIEIGKFSTRLVDQLPKRTRIVKDVLAMQLICGRPDGKASKTFELAILSISDWCWSLEWVSFWGWCEQA